MKLRAINEENFLMSNYNPKILNLLNDKKGEAIKIGLLIY